MSLSFDNRGLLPKGRHPCKTWADFRTAFAFNQHREQQLARLHLFLKAELIPVAKGLEFVVGGSYLSDKPVPSDIDCTIAVPFSTATNYRPLMVLAPDGDKKRIYTQYGVEFYVSLEMPGAPDFRVFFTYVGEKTARAKGLAAKDLRGTVKVEQWETL